MKNVLLPIFLATALMLSACPSSSLSSAASSANQKLEAQGLPFRWSVQDTGSGEGMVMHMLPLPVGQTRADAQTSQEILGAIRHKEQGKGRARAELQEVRQMQDGREVWVLQSLGAGIAYVVTLGNPTQGITKIGLLGPYDYAK
jgi:hypothetical protein